MAPARRRFVNPARVDEAIHGLSRQHGEALASRGSLRKVKKGQRREGVTPRGKSASEEPPQCGIDQKTGCQPHQDR